jgi:hypothetical protein
LPTSDALEEILQDDAVAMGRRNLFQTKDRTSDIILHFGAAKREQEEKLNAFCVWFDMYKVPPPPPSLSSQDSPFSDEAFADDIAAIDANELIFQDASDVDAFAPDDPLHPRAEVLRAFDSFEAANQRLGVVAARLQHVIHSDLQKRAAVGVCVFFSSSRLRTC